MNIEVVIYIIVCLLILEMLIQLPPIQSIISRSLFKRLMKVAEFEKIPIMIKEFSEMDGAIGQYLWKHSEGRWIRADSIVLSTDYQNCPIVLAHELGHHFMIRDNENESEGAADRKGYQICKENASFLEWYIMKVTFFLHFFFLSHEYHPEKTQKTTQPETVIIKYYVNSAFTSTITQTPSTQRYFNYSNSITSTTSTTSTLNSGKYRLNKYI